jgi:LPS sulfotransferase NodH
MDPIFPISVKYIKKLNSETIQPSVVISNKSWVDPLKNILTNPLFSFREWEDHNSEDILAGISSFKTILISFPEGEDQITAQVKNRIGHDGSDAVVLRLLRDVFMRTSLSLGGQLVPQENWKTCPPGSPPYFIFATPRSGSSFFCDILDKTKLLGHPKEHLRDDLLPVFFNTDLTFNEWIRALVKYSFTSNGYSSTKLISHLFLEIIENYQDRPDLVEDLMNFFKPYPVIYLLRRNKVRQAISLIIATKTAVWHIIDDVKITSAQQDHNQEDGPEEIENKMIWFYEQEKQMAEFFKRAGIAPHTYFYEDFSNDKKSHGIYQEIGKFLQVIIPGDLPEANYSVMSDEQNETLVKQYYKYLDKKIRASDFPQEPLASFLISSMMAEMESLTRKTDPKTSFAKPSKKKWWQLF